MRENHRLLVDKFWTKQVLVIGDTIIDKSTYGKAEGLSLESPTLKASFQKETISCGGAANVARNLHRLGVKTTFVTGCSDVTAVSMMRGSTAMNVYNLCGSSENVKQRFYVERGNEVYKYFQLNSTADRLMDQRSTDILMRRVVNDHADYDVVVFSDYNCNFITAEVRSAFFDLARKKGSKVYAAAQVSGPSNNLSFYRAADCVVMNEAESQTFKPAGAYYITDGANGSIYKSGVVAHRAPAVKVANATNVIGAGDAFFAAVVAGYFDPVTANVFANEWASAYIQKPFGELPCLAGL